MPTGIIATYFMSNDEGRKKYYNAYSYTAFTLFLCILIISLLCKKTKINVNIISAVGLAIWAILSFIVIKIFKLDK